MRTALTSLVAAFATAFSWVAAYADVAPRRLTCEHVEHPFGIDSRQPKLGWWLFSTERNQSQAAYQILVASTPELLAPGRADLWDPGKIASSASAAITYCGAPLSSGQRVHWTVRVWDQDGRASSWSEPSWWEMGLLEAADWTGMWISHDHPLPAWDEDFYGDDQAPLLRKEFTLARTVRRARARVAGLGYYELRINGECVGDHRLDPGWTNYSKRVLYSTYDVTDMLADGENVVGIMLGNGWYNPLPMWGWGSPERNLRKHLPVGRPRGLLQLDIEFDDESTTSVVTDRSWKSAPGPIIRNSVFLGEQYDAREEHPGWDRADFDDARWSPVVQATDPVGALHPQLAPPIRVIERIKPIAVTEPASGVFVVDMGRNFAGVVQLRVRGPRGTRVTMRSGELLFPDGMLNGRTAAPMQIKNGGASGGPGCPVDAWQTDVYVLRGGSQADVAGGEEVYIPRFTFHGFRYVELTGFPGTPTVDTLEGHVLCSDVPTVGEFECSNELFNRIHEMVVRTFRSNLLSVQSDCPHREKFGYGGDLVATSEAFMLNFDMAHFYRKAVLDLADAVRPNGGFTETAPYVGIADESLGDGAGPVEWGSAHPLLCRQLHQYYADIELMRQQYPLILQWNELLASRSQDSILDNGIGDHESLVAKSRAVTGAAFHQLNAALASEIADLLQRPDDAELFTSRKHDINTAMLRRFLDPETGRVESGTQCNQAAMLALGVGDQHQRQIMLDALVRDLDARDGHLTTGIFGTRWMLMALSDANRADLAYRIVQQPSFPGWGHMVANGATTLWETWAPSDNIFSHNHPMFGSVDEWFYKVVAGLRAAPDAVGFDRVIIQPRVGGGLTWARARYESIRGPISTSWRLENRRFHLAVSIPCGVSGMVHVPSIESVTESGLSAMDASERGVRFVGHEAGASVFAISSGEYSFECEMK